MSTIFVKVVLGIFMAYVLLMMARVNCLVDFCNSMQMFKDDS